MISRQRLEAGAQSVSERPEGHAAGRTWNVGWTRQLGTRFWPRPDSGFFRLLLSFLAGLALLAAFPNYDCWWLAPVGVAGAAWAVIGVRLRAAAGLGLVTGLAWFVPLLAWTNLNTGWTPWLLLCVSQSVFISLLGVGLAWVGPVVKRWPGWWPVLTAVAWTAQEALRDRLPFGGFPWGRLAFSQADSPLLGFARFGGAPLVSAVVAGLGGALLALLLFLVTWWQRRVLPGGRAAWAATGVMAVLVAGGCFVPVAGVTGPLVTVAIVQGNVPRMGLDFNAQRRAVLENHVQRTLELAADVAAGRVQRPDLVVWPENSSDIDPFSDVVAGARITEAARAVGVPVLVGAMLDARSGVFNAGLVWEPSGVVSARYYKRHPVPFAEYLPLATLAKMVSDKASMVAGVQPGRSVGVLRAGSLVVGDVICFEVAYDYLVRDVVVGGAGLLVVQTNNATFNVAEARQQLAMVRLRAVEHGRPALMASTVGISGFVGVDGRVVAQSEFFRPAVLVRGVRLGSGRTLATVVGPWPEYVISLGFVGLLVVAWRLRRSVVGAAAVSG